MRTKPLILDVDDDEAGRYAIGRQLTQAGYDVRGAGTGARGLELASSERPDLILLDIRLPDIDGFEVCKRIRETPSIADTPIIQLSASYIDTLSRAKGLNNGADAYLTEPVEPEILLATVNSLLRMKRAEQRVRRGALQWQATFDAIKDGVALLDVNGEIVQANHAFEEIGGRAMAAALTDDMLPKMRNTLSRCTEEREWNNRMIVLTLDPVLNERSEFEGCVCIASDVTERRMFEQQLRHTAKLESIGVLAGGIAHDFNNLLTGILGNSSLLVDSIPENSPQHEMAREIYEAGESAADLTRQILAYSGKGRFVMDPVDFSAIAIECRAFVRRFIPTGVELVYEVTSGLPQVLADKSQIQQLMMNLIINAAESFREDSKGRVLVRTSTSALGPDFFQPGEENKPGEYVSFEVSDNGSGMDAATQHRIFDPFFTTKFAGRGLGLSAVQGILRGHGGLLRLESSPGVGTTFLVYFPVDTSTPRPAAEAPKPARSDRRATILVVDDEATVRSFARTALRLRGYNVLLAESGPDAIARFTTERENIDAVLLDLTMPGMDGKETFDRLRAMDSAMPVVLSSGFNRSVAEERFRGTGIAGFLGKPYTGNQLVDAMNAAIEAYSLDR